MENKGFDLPWYMNVTIIFGVLVLLLEKSSMGDPGFWAANWWPIVRLIGGFGVFLWFIDGCFNGPAHRSYKRKLP